ncbi:hypothetical protein ACROYT_G034580 [Oculina patagonica]
MALLWLFFTLLLAVNTALSARIAGFSTMGRSHYINTRHTLQELASRGHEVVIVVPSFENIKPNEKVPHKIYQVPYKPGVLEDKVFRPALQGNAIPAFFAMEELVTNLCDSALDNTEVLNELKGFDLLIYENLDLCAVLIGELLDISRVEVMPGPSNPAALKHMIPMPISYVPQVLTGLTDKMTFVERVINLGAYIGGKIFMHFAIYRPFEALKIKYNIKPERSFQEAAGDVELVIITADFALEYAQPLLPGNVMIGPLNVKDAAEPLPPDLDKFISSSGGHGFIIVSFGTYVVSALPKPVVDMLATAFGKLKQRVVWRLKGYVPSSLAPNIKVMDWLPQNDLLAHKDIKAFVSHVGQNSFYESVYHGVPVVACPLWGDQHSNAKKVENFGLGLAVDYKTNNAQQMFEAIERVINEPRFKTRAMNISRLLRDHPRTPLQETCDWIEYVLRHGGARHLRAQVFNIPWYQYYLLDVVAFLVAIVTMVVVVIRLACECLCRVCCKRGDDKPKKE